MDPTLADVSPRPLPDACGWAALFAALALGCGAAGPAARREPPADPAAAGLRVAFTSQQGHSPPGQNVPVELREGAPAPAVHVSYTGDDGWLLAGVFGSGARRSLALQPASQRLGPGQYRAVIEIAGGAAAPAQVEVVLAVVAPSGVSCPAGSTLRYAGGGDGRTEPADFGRTFFAHYCLRCHAAGVPEAKRAGAPPELNWDSHEAIREQRNWIDAAAAREVGQGRDGVPGFVMPPSAVKVRPPQAERDLLARWIACGAL